MPITYPTTPLPDDEDAPHLDDEAMREEINAWKVIFRQLDERRNRLQATCRPSR